MDPVADDAGGKITPVKGRDRDEVFLRAQRHAQRSPKGASRVAKAFRGGWAAMFKKTREDAFERVNDDFKLAYKTLEDETAHLVKFGTSFGAGFAEHVGTLSGLAQCLKKTVPTGHVAYERSNKEPNKNRGLGE